MVRGARVLPETHRDSQSNHKELKGGCLTKAFFWFMPPKSRRTLATQAPTQAHENPLPRGLDVDEMTAWGKVGPQMASQGMHFAWLSAASKAEKGKNWGMKKAGKSRPFHCVSKRRSDDRHLDGTQAFWSLLYFVGDHVVFGDVAIA